MKRRWFAWRMSIRGLETRGCFGWALHHSSEPIALGLVCRCFHQWMSGFSMRMSRCRILSISSDALVVSRCPGRLVRCWCLYGKHWHTLPMLQFSQATADFFFGSRLLSMCILFRVRNQRKIVWTTEKFIGTVEKRLSFIIHDDDDYYFSELSSAPTITFAWNDHLMKFQCLEHNLNVSNIRLFWLVNGNWSLITSISGGFNSKWRYDFSDPFGQMIDWKSVNDNLLNRFEIRLENSCLTEYFDGKTW